MVAAPRGAMELASLPFHRWEGGGGGAHPCRNHSRYSNCRSLAPGQDNGPQCPSHVSLHLWYLPAAAGLCVRRCQAMTLVLCSKTLSSKKLPFKVQWCLFALIRNEEDAVLEGEACIVLTSHRGACKVKGALCHYRQLRKRKSVATTGPTLLCLRT